MIKFKTDEFLSHFFESEDEVVEVKACELQRFIRKSRKENTEIKELKAMNDFLSTRVRIAEDKVKQLDLKKEPNYVLDLKV